MQALKSLTYEEPFVDLVHTIKTEIINVRGLAPKYFNLISFFGLGPGN